MLLLSVINYSNTVYNVINYYIIFLFCFPTGGDTESIKFSANAPVFKPRGQPVYQPHPPQGAPRGGHPAPHGGPHVSEQGTLPPRMPGVTSAPHTVTMIPTQQNFSTQNPPPFSIPRE